MRNLDEVLKHKSIDYTKLLKYGFRKEEDKYVLKEKMIDNQFEMLVIFSKKENISKLIDIANEDEYILVDIEDSVGEFVGKVRQEYEEKLDDIIRKCTYKDIFKVKQSKDVIKYIKEKYDDELEFLWEKFDTNAIWRNKLNDKWYGLIGTIGADKIGIDSRDEIEILNLRYQKDSVEDIIDKKHIYPAYHMNKKSWITIKLDGSIDNKKIFKLIDNSYQLSIGNKSGKTIKVLSQKVYDYLLTIPKSKVVTYGQVAEYLGNKGLARIVGTILHKNPDGDKYPCYKVLNAKGELADEFVFGGKKVQKERLEKDGIEVVDNRVDLKTYQWKEN